jgi:hypothetical protein
MIEARPGSSNTAEAAADPTTVVGLIFRILNRPSRTLCLTAILALILAGAAELLHAPAIVRLPVAGGAWSSAAAAYCPSASARSCTTVAQPCRAAQDRLPDGHRPAAARTCSATGGRPLGRVPRRKVSGGPV